MALLHSVSRASVNASEPGRVPADRRPGPAPAEPHDPPPALPAASVPGERAPVPATRSTTAADDGSVASSVSAPATDPTARSSTAAVARPTTRNAPVRPVPRGWPQYRLALWCGGLPLVSGVTITAIAASTGSSAVFSAMALAGLLTLGVGLVLFVVGWAALFEHGRRLRQRTAEELALEPAPPAELAGLLLLINLPAALVCLSIAVSQAAANPAFC